jgi:hypothetical protein
MAAGLSRASMSPAFSRAVHGTRAVFGGALEWDGADARDPSAMAVTALGMGVPILIGVLIGRPNIGLAASLGAMWVGAAPRGASLKEHWQIVRDIVVAAIAAAVAAAIVAQHGPWSDAGLVLAAGAAALLGGFSRPMAVASQRFIIFATIGLGVAAHTPNRIALVVLIAEGALWAALCGLAIGAVARRFDIGSIVASERGSTASFEQKFRRWRGTLRTWAIWNYPVRLMTCLACAAAIKGAFPQHHYSWIAVAVALLTQRQSDNLVAKVSQRALGVAAGVVATEAIAIHPLPGWALVAIIATLAALSPWLRNRSYVAYTAATTPLIMLLTSGGETIGQGLLIDRLIATLIAAGLVITAFLAARQLMPPPSPDNRRSG